LNNLLAGALVAILASTVTTLVAAYVAHRRELSVRWDTSRLTILTDALVSTSRASGNIYHWARGGYAGEFGSDEALDTPTRLSTAVDRSYYDLLKLSLVLPQLRSDAEELQVLLMRKRDSCRDAWLRGSRPENDAEFLAVERAISEEMHVLMNTIRNESQKALQIRGQRSSGRFSSGSRRGTARAPSSRP